MLNPNYAIQGFQHARMCFFSEAVEQLSLINFVTFLRLVAVRVIEPSECTLSLQNPYTEEKI